MENGFEEMPQSSNYQLDRPEIIDRTKLKSAEVEIKDIVWYVRHDTPWFDNVSLVNEHILSKKNTE